MGQRFASPPSCRTRSSLRSRKADLDVQRLSGSADLFPIPSPGICEAKPLQRVGEPETGEALVITRRHPN